MQIIKHANNKMISTAYKDLKDRKETRQAAWEQPGWDECVRRTGKDHIV